MEKAEGGGEEELGGELEEEEGEGEGSEAEAACSNRSCD